jgi:hypothetical protein
MDAPVRTSPIEADARNTILNALNQFNNSDKLMNLGLFIEPRLMSRLLFLDFIYKKILPIQGVILDIGTRWGQTATVFETLRAIYEPYNYQRKIVAFDTFTGFSGSSEYDGVLKNVDGECSTTVEYQQQLELLLQAHEDLHPINHVKKHQVVSGDVITSLPRYIQNNPETIISLAYFDLDLYKPTLSALETIKDRLTIGSVLVFDELNYSGAPGETLAVMQAIGLRNVSIKRFPYCSRVSYMEII